MAENHYQILGIPRDADEKEIKRAYHKLARELHPDKAENPDQAQGMEQQFALVSTAYNLLKDAALRAEYDRKTFGSGGAGGGSDSVGPTPTSSVMGTSKSAKPAAPPPPKAAGPAPKPQPMGGTNEQRSMIAQKAYTKGMQLMKDKDWAKASEFFEAAIQNNENEAAYHAKLAITLVEAKKSAARAIEAAKRAVELDRFNLDYKFTLAQIYQTIGSKSNALKVYEDILKWDKDNKMAQQMLRQLNKREDAFGKFSEQLVGPGSALGKLKKFLGGGK